MEWVKKTITRIRAFHKNHGTSRLTMYKDFLFAIGKVLLGIVLQSGFFYITALYSVCVAFAKFFFFEGKAEKGESENSFLKMSICVLLGSLSYCAYMLRLFFVQSNLNYGMIPSIAIATFAFTELVLTIVGIRKARGLMELGLKMVNLTSALTAIVLTQVAILSFTNIGDHSKYNAIAGLVFGLICVLIGIIMVCIYAKESGKDKKLER